MKNPLQDLEARLRPIIAVGQRPMPSDGRIDTVLTELNKHAHGPGALPSEDRQQEALQRFWQNQKIQNGQDARLLCWSLYLPHHPSGSCILEDPQRFRSVLAGLRQWQTPPHIFRVFYRGLVSSYFSYDGNQKPGNDCWVALRRYLSDNIIRIRSQNNGDRPNPEWVEAAIQNQQMFSQQPCQFYADKLLSGDSSELDKLRRQLGIPRSSWFERELILGQVRGATRYKDLKFQQLLPRLLSLLADNAVLQNDGMELILNRYASIAGMPLHKELRDKAVEWWGNPWLPSQQVQWNRVQPQAKEMVTSWLKLEFIEAFFTLLAQDGAANPRRMNFWKRYVKAIDHIEFALGVQSRSNGNPDFVVLRQKMTGLLRQLEAPRNDAFIMHIGSLVIVEFGQTSNALYIYDKGSVPFDTNKILHLGVDEPNSLKNSNYLQKSHHTDNWELNFENQLSQFRIKPMQQPYSQLALRKFAEENNLLIVDKSAQGGYIRVLGDYSDSIDVALSGWEFTFDDRKGGWYRR